MGDEEYQALRNEQLWAYYEAGVPIGDCWVDDPSSFSEVLLTCVPEGGYFDLFNNLGYFEEQSKSTIQDWLNLESELWLEIDPLTSVIGMNNGFFQDYVRDEIFSKLNFELVLYDEIEKFRDYDDPEFNYPYQPRKTKLNSFTFDNSKFQYVEGIYSLLNYEYSS